MRSLVFGLFFIVCFIFSGLIYADSTDQSPDSEVLVSPPNHPISSDQGSSSSAANAQGAFLNQINQENPEHSGQEGRHRHRKHSSDDPSSAEAPLSSGQ